MLHIQNIINIADRNVFGGWKITDVDSDVNTDRYIFVIECFSPIGVVMDKCTISLERHGRMIKTMTHPTTHSYFFFYNGNITNVCGGAEWLGNIDNFLSQIRLVIKSYHLLT